MFTDDALFFNSIGIDIFPYNRKYELILRNHALNRICKKTSSILDYLKELISKIDISKKKFKREIREYGIDFLSFYSDTYIIYDIHIVDITNNYVINSKYFFQDIRIGSTDKIILILMGISCEYCNLLDSEFYFFCQPPISCIFDKFLALIAISSWSESSCRVMGFTDHPWSICISFEEFQGS